jgi:hypothetical protein
LAAAISQQNFLKDQHIGGVNTCILPTPDVDMMHDSERFGGSTTRSGGKPSYVRFELPILLHRVTSRAAAKSSYTILYCIPK